MAGAGLGLALSVPAGRALAQEAPATPPPAGPRVRLGLIGCGGRGQWLIDHFAAHGGYALAAVADPFADQAEAAAAKGGVPPERVFTGLLCAQKMIAAGGLDAVAIISPPYFHPEQARAAVDAGLHVFLAKPAAVDVPGCESIRKTGEKARRGGLVFLVDFQTRPNEFFIEAMRRLHTGMLGDLCFGESTYHSNRLPIKAPTGSPGARLRNWVFDQALSGDIIVEQNIHTLDVMSWAMQERPPLRCAGTGGRRVRVDVGDCWDHFALVYEYPDDVGITFSSRQFDAHGTPGGIHNRMFGTKGVLLTTYGGEVMVRGEAEVFYRGGTTNTIYRDGVLANIAAMHTAIGGGDSSNPTLEPSVMSNLVAILGRMAAHSGRPVTWDEMMERGERLQADLSGLAD